MSKLQGPKGRAPKGLEDSAQGFNQVSTLGTGHPERFALKGRRIERTNNAKVGQIFLITPGTSCLAAIILSLRDKTHFPGRGFH
jgi:hypothetical protein